MRAYSPRAHVGDILGLLDALDLRRVHVVGHDWGAAIAWMAAALAPQRVQTLTALSVGHPAAFRSAGWGQTAKSWYMVLFQFRGLAERWLSADDFRNFRRWSGHPDADAVVEQLRDPEALTASLNIYRAAGRPRALIQRPTGLARRRTQGNLPAVSVPTLGVWGRHDPALGERQMTGSAQYVTGPWRYERFEDCGHWMMLEAPERLAALLLQLLAGH